MVRLCDAMGCHDANLFSLFQSGEITFPVQNAFNTQTPHLYWGAVAMDKIENQKAIRVYLRQSKMDQFGRGTEVIMGRTTNLLCPAAVVVEFMRVRGTLLGPFIFRDGTALSNEKFAQITT